jgi:hypothetical protein
VLLEGQSALQVKVTGKNLPKHSIHLKGYFVNNSNFEIYPIGHGTENLLTAEINTG